MTIIDEYHAKAKGLFDVVLTRTGLHSDVGYRDLIRLHGCRKAIGYRTALGPVLQLAIGKRLNPYDYLHKWFTEEELKRIYSLHDHTKEQLEYLISLKDPMGFCDRHTRQELYKLFSVPLEEMPDQPEERLDIH